MAVKMMWEGSPAKILWRGSPQKVAWSEPSTCLADCCAGGTCTAHDYVGLGELYYDVDLHEGQHDPSVKSTYHGGDLTGAGFVMADECKRSFMTYMHSAAGTVPTLRLYKTDIAPLRNRVYSDYHPANQADFSGYAPFAYGWTQRLAVDANGWMFVYPSPASGSKFTHNGGGVANNIYGIYCDYNNVTYPEATMIGDFTAGGLVPADDPVLMNCAAGDIDPQPGFAYPNMIRLGLNGTNGSRAPGEMVICDQLELLLHSRIVQAGVSWIGCGLFKTDRAPLRTDTFNAYTIGVGKYNADFSGYSLATAFFGAAGVGDNAPALDAGKSYIDNDTEASFAHNTGTTNNDIYGYWLFYRLPAAWLLVGGERFNEAPITMDDATDWIKVNCRSLLWDANQP